MLEEADLLSEVRQARGGREPQSQGPGVPSWLLRERNHSAGCWRNTGPEHVARPAWMGPGEGRQRGGVDLFCLVGMGGAAGCV